MDTQLTSVVTTALLGENNTCKASSNSILSCSADILADRCHVTFSCENVANEKVTQCSFVLAEVAKTVADVTAKLLAEEADATALVASTIESSTAPGLSIVSINDKIENYINVNCSTSVNSVQSIVCPIMVSDCTDENILAINKLDASATCALTKANDLLQASGLGTKLGSAATTSSIQKQLKRILIVAVVIIFGGLGAAVFLGLLLRRKVVYQAQARLQLQRQLQLQLQPFPPY